MPVLRLNRNKHQMGLVRSATTERSFCSRSSVQDTVDTDMDQWRCYEVLAKRRFAKQADHSLGLQRQRRFQSPRMRSKAPLTLRIAPPNTSPLGCRGAAPGSKPRLVSTSARCRGLKPPCSSPSSCRKSLRFRASWKLSGRRSPHV